MGRRDVGRGPRDPLVERQADLADLVTVQPVRRGERQATRGVVEQVERADLDVERLRRPLHERQHELVPVARLRREPGELVQERELAERPRRVLVDAGHDEGDVRAARGRGCRLLDHRRDCGAGPRNLRGRAPTRLSVFAQDGVPAVRPVRDRGVQSREERVGPGPGRTVMGAHGAVTGGLRAEWQAEDLDEPDGRGVVEGVARVVRGQVLLVQRERRAPARDDRAAVIEPDPDLARDDALRARDVAPQIAVERAEPEAVVGQLGELVGHPAVEAQRVLGERQRFERGVGGVEDGRRGRLVDLAALDADEAILDVVDPPDPVRPGDLVEALDERDRVETLAVQAHRDAPLEVEQDVHCRRSVGRRDGPGVGIGRRGGPRVLEDPRLAGAAPHVDVDRVRARLRDRELDSAGVGVVDRLLARQAHADAHRRDDLEGRVQGVDRDVEADLVVALAGAAVGHRVGALLLGDLDEELRDERTRERRRQRVDALVARVGLEARPAEVPHERLAGIDHVGARRPGGDGAPLDAGPQGSTAHVHGQRDDLGAELLAEPGDRDGRVETARVREDHLLHVRAASVSRVYG